MALTSNTGDAARIRKASAGDIPRIASTLSEAFFHDPVFGWIHPNDARRRKVLPSFFALFAETLKRHEEVYVAADGTGAALWVPPGQPVASEEEADEFARRWRRCPERMQSARLPSAS